MMMYEKIPAELKSLRTWVLWKKKVLDKGKITKIPVDPHTGLPARTNDPQTWSNFETALSKISEFSADGVGFVFAGGYFGVDLDNCSEELKQEFMAGLKSYTELSQSGSGIHIICRGELPKGSRRRGGVEMYDGGRFFVMTGNAIGEFSEISDGSELIKPLHNKYLNAEKYEYVMEKGKSTLSDEDVVKKASTSKNNALFNLLMAGQWEGLYDSQSEADMAFCLLLAFWTNKDKAQMDRVFRTSGLMRPKWERKQNNTTYGNITIENAANRVKSVYDPIYNEQQVTVNSSTGEVRVVSRGEDYELNDTGNAHRFADMFGEVVKYNSDNKIFMVWNGMYWEPDSKGSIKNMAEIVIEEMKKDAFAEDDRELQKAKFNNVQKAYSSKGKENMLKESMHLAEIPCVNNDFDKGHWVINTHNGVIDLTNGSLKNHEKVFMMSKIAGTSKAHGEPKRWIKFLNEILLGDKQMVDFIQKSIGYTLTGSIKEQCMFICYGEGSNGKSVFLDVLTALLGDYSRVARVESLLSKRNDSGNNTQDIARLKGARLVITGEPNEGSKFNEGLVKQLTGGDVITARFLYGKEFEFKPEFKLWLATNHKPIIRGTDRGIWRRIRLIPFEMQIPDEKQDKELTEKLLEELPQIMNWAVEGTLIWLSEGLRSPKSVEDATKEYRNEMDVINSFIEEECQEVKGWETKAADVYEVYSQWGKTNNEFVMSATRFGREFSKRYDRKRKSDGGYYVGLRLNKDDTSYVYKAI
jgi:putative DNA primase/helicase